ncbi:MAG TPA: hypothetical protein VKY24_03455 [Reyranella sp.]|nr:hypothetical protein [Reyranella sp.]
MTLKSEIQAAEQRHAMRLLWLKYPNWYNDQRGIARASQRLMEKEVAAIRKRAANDNEKRLSQCAGTVTDFDPTAGSKE